VILIGSSDLQGDAWGVHEKCKGTIFGAVKCDNIR